MNVILFDTETTGLKDNRIIQFAYKDMSTGEVVNQYFDPKIPIQHESMGVHHIRQEDIEGRPIFCESEEFRKIQEMMSTKIFVAHNASYDFQALANEDIDLPKFHICTYKVAYEYLPELQSYKLQSLRYSQGLDTPELRKLMPHDALCDILILENLFFYLFEKVQNELKTTDEKQILTKMINISKRPIFFRTFNFGKYKDEYVQDIAKKDMGYLRWIFNNKEMSEDWRYTTGEYLKNI